MKTAYTMLSGVKFKALELIDVKALERATKDQWVNQTLCEVNDSVVRLGVLKGEFHWHKHDKEDEFFYVVEGCLHIDLIDPNDPATTEENPRTITLNPRQGVVIPKGIFHRPRAPQRTVMLMVETDTIKPTGS